jgi:molecular chaperone DnaK
VSIVGIDLGTTNTVVGIVRAGQAAAVRDAEGQYLIPSVVSFDASGTVLVGRPAKERRTVDAANTIYSIKRLIGRSWGSEEVEKARTRFPFEMREGPGQAALVVARGETFTLPEVSAFVLRHARAIAEKALGVEVERAVITVPANFNDLQRAATKVAGRVAGLEVLRILNEPTAAALAYGYGRSKGERIVIYDFGGGTFDVTLLDLSGNVFEVLATAGDTFLGGDDIDLAIADRMVEVCQKKLGIDARANAQVFERLRYYAETVKVNLTTADRTSVEVLDVGSAGKKQVNVPFSMTRAELEALAAPIVDSTFEVCRDALGVARLEPNAFDQVVLVGGSTRLPIVRRAVEKFFGRAPLDRVSADEVVAIGAAIQASALTGSDRRRGGVPKPPLPAARPLDESVTTEFPQEEPERSTLLGPAPSGTVKPPLPRRNTRGGAAARARATTNAGLGANPVKTMPGVSPTKTARPPGLRDRPAPPGPPALPVPAATPARGGTLSGVSAYDHRDADDEPTQVKPSPSMAPLPMETKGVAPSELPPIPSEDRRTHMGLGAVVAPPARPEFSLPVPSIAPGARPVSLSPAAPNAPLPLLIDVTPLSLTVETVSGFCDVIITRNTPVPCEQSRLFVTAQDGQESVHIRVGQGESGRFSENTLLGELELTGLRRAERGKVRIEVAFELDTDGLLQVHAIDAESGKATSARLRLIGLPEAEEVDVLRARQAARPSA